MTQPLDLERMREPFEAHPALASWIERFAVTDMNMSLGDWMVFISALNNALSSERAARVDAEGERDAALREMSKYAREAGEAIGKLETSELAGIVEGWKDRALSAEAQVSALQAQVDGLRGVVDSAYSEIIRMERASLVGRTHDQWERAFRSGVKAARQSFGARIATLSQPPADEPAKGGE